MVWRWLGGVQNARKIYEFGSYFLCLLYNVHRCPEINNGILKLLNYIRDAFEYSNFQRWQQQQQQQRWRRPIFGVENEVPRRRWLGKRWEDAKTLAATHFWHFLNYFVSGNESKDANTYTKIKSIPPWGSADSMRNTKTYCRILNGIAQRQTTWYMSLWTSAITCWMREHGGNGC